MRLIKEEQGKKKRQRKLREEGGVTKVKDAMIEQ